MSTITTTTVTGYISETDNYEVYYSSFTRNYHVRCKDTGNTSGPSFVDAVDAVAYMNTRQDDYDHYYDEAR